MINTETEFSKHHLNLKAFKHLKEKRQDDIREAKSLETVNVIKTEIKFRYPKNGLYGLL